MQRLSLRTYLVILFPIILVLLFLYYHLIPHTQITPPPINLYAASTSEFRLSGSATVDFVIHSGIPSASDYREILIGKDHHEDFVKIEEYSLGFVKNYENDLKELSETTEVFHMGTRAWEYSYVYLGIKEILNEWKLGDKRVEIMDLGSGVTFFPFWLATQFPNVYITAVDSSSSCSTTFQHILEKEVNYKQRISFKKDDIKTVKSQEKFDIVYSISVFSFISNFAKTVQHVKDLLNPGGIFLLSFDLSLDHKQELSEEKSLTLLYELQKSFCDIHPFPISISERLRQPEPIWSTAHLTEVSSTLTAPNPDSDTTTVLAAFRKCK